MAWGWLLRERDSSLSMRHPRFKAVVWVHNSHVGNARHTDMVSLRNELNVGQLCREQYGTRWH